MQYGSMLMNKEVAMAVLQVKGMNDGLYGALGRRAALDHRSISQEVVAIIEKHLSTPARMTASPDDEALQLAGSWNDSRSPEEIAGSIRTDRTTERFNG
jgi:plasmid stability protein